MRQKKFVMGLAEPGMNRGLVVINYIYIFRASLK